MIMNGPHWIKQWIADLALLNEQFRDENGTVDFDALGREEFQFRMALITRNFKKSERAKVVFEQAAAAYQVNVERGKKGGRPRKNSSEQDEALVNQQRGEADSLRGECHSAPPRTSGPMPEDRQVVIDFAVAEGLDVDDACECWYVTINERDGLTADGKKINSWKAYVRKWCTTRKNNRRTA